MDYKKITERLANYKLAKGFTIPDYTGHTPMWPDIYGTSGDSLENKQIFIRQLGRYVKQRHSKNAFIRYMSRLEDNKPATTENKIARRLIRLKLQNGEELPDYTSHGDIYGEIDPRNKNEDMAIWARKLERIVKMRHSKLGLIRRLSRIKQ